LRKIKNEGSYISYPIYIFPYKGEDFSFPPSLNANGRQAEWRKKNWG